MKKEIKERQPQYFVFDKTWRDLSYPFGMITLFEEEPSKVIDEIQSNTLLSAQIKKDLVSKILSLKKEVKVFRGKNLEISIETIVNNIGTSFSITGAFLRPLREEETEEDLEEQEIRLAELQELKRLKDKYESGESE